MKYASLITIVFDVSTFLFAQNTKAASTDTADVRIYTFVKD
jgi:hypothetical protein